MYPDFGLLPFYLPLLSSVTFPHLMVLFMGEDTHIHREIVYTDSIIYTYASNVSACVCTHVHITTHIHTQTVGNRWVDN
jgi:hypothetical protein